MERHPDYNPFERVRRTYPYTPRERRLQRLKCRTGITKEEYELLEKQADGKCCICGEQQPLVLDHDHATKKVRALICSPCNKGLGGFRDNPKFLEAAAQYLIAHQKTSGRPSKSC